MADERPRYDRPLPLVLVEWRATAQNAEGATRASRSPADRDLSYLSVGWLLDDTPGIKRLASRIRVVDRFAIADDINSVTIRTEDIVNTIAIAPGLRALADKLTELAESMEESN